ncbi:MAG: preprotein translocase subunit SecA [Oscillospiraceae bacterium]|nr:preprotein translocase subunit SecA [Oscillospiraceae bacterium]
MGLAEKLFGTASTRELKRIRPIVNAVLSKDDEYKAMSENELRGRTEWLKGRLANGETLDDILPDAFATCREAAYRVLGMKPFPVQVTGGIILHRGEIAEMKTGEGKTLVATMPVYLNALAGKGVHVVTVNDYLAKRDSEWMGKVYSYLGLSVGLIIAGMESAERKKAYNCDITYGTNNEFGFDYLRDNMVITLEGKSQRGHSYAIVDEVDSILIDEARTPLIISGAGDKSTDLYRQADDFAKRLNMIRVKETDDKEELDSLGGDAIVDEKARNVSLTAMGIEKAQRFFGVTNLADSENMTLSHHINQAIKARGIMKRDVDYVVKDGEVIIVDEFTGRLMYGRRYNDGLHQAIEAKEQVHVARESKTLATITFQNYFRMYDKLAGMTGTALTEQDEFKEIYGLDVIEIPTNKPLLRIDYDDVIYKTENAKFNAVIENIVECHAKNQPVLVGTVDIEKSERLSKMLKKRGIPHEVLNAKYHEKEAAIVAQAGVPGAVTIATNMAGRGTDIMLGGNAEFMARAQMAKDGYDEEQINIATSYYESDDEEVLKLRDTFYKLNEKFRKEVEPLAEEAKEAGGLFIIGTERHESRRIDNQLRGRSGRQGDRGESRFYLALEDDLLRLFGGDRITKLMDNLNVDEDMPLETKMLSSVIESAQKRVEGRNFSIRKNVLNYDDVMNAQREEIYSERDKVLAGEDIKDQIISMLTESIDNNTAIFLGETDDHSEWNMTGLRNHYLGWMITPADLTFTPEQLQKMSRQDISDKLKAIALKKYNDKEARLGSEDMRRLERLVLLRVVDTKWMNHIDAMDELRKGIGLRSYAQRNPVVEYRIEGYNMFDEMVASIREDTAHLMLTAELIRPLQQAAQQNVNEADNTNRASSNKQALMRDRNKKKKIGRNDKCPCGSGKKYKDCHGRTPEKI